MNHAEKAFVQRMRTNYSRSIILIRTMRLNGEDLNYLLICELRMISLANFNSRPLPPSSLFVFGYVMNDFEGYISPTVDPLYSSQEIVLA